MGTARGRRGRRATRWALVCAAAIGLLAPVPPADAQARLRRPERMNPHIDAVAEAAHVARRLDPEATFLDSARVDSVARALAAIRAAHPDLEGVWDDGQPYFLEVALEEDLARRLKARAVGVDSTSLLVHRLFRLPPDGAGGTRTGHARLDSLNRALDVEIFSLRDMGDDGSTSVLVMFRHAMNLDRVGEEYERVPGVSFTRMAEMRIPSYASITVDRRADGGDSPWRFVFRYGRGDCPAGCIEHYTTAIDFAWRTGAVTRHPEEKL